ncbi:hypothetical protein [Mucilaginibacter agri]|uniref:Uncharacterized protein n=1 Tax=Mucilaginibacter agri TaxID=2695265 RepID=A0A965ZDD5_9SPHI|nr:hypothetical protein [Mucilaginibacter agri]NCD68645.1 hypothetical protein [Mucilaginibacter agri]
MKKASYILLVAGLVVMIAGLFVFGHVNQDNAVDSHVRGVYINGFRSFPWPVFAGFVVFMIGITFNISDQERVGQRFINDHARHA